MYLFKGEIFFPCLDNQNVFFLHIALKLLTFDRWYYIYIYAFIGWY